MWFCRALSVFLTLILPLSYAVLLNSSSDLAATYDFIIVGGGTAGNVVANRLSENPEVQVLVIEAGVSPEGVLEIEVPLLSASLLGSQFDWNFTTTPQEKLGGRAIAYHRGHGLGGSSSINSMVYTRGAAEDYNKIADLSGDEGWSWDSLQPYIRKQERWSHPSDNHNTTGQFNISVHGFHGMIPVSLNGFPLPIEGMVLQTTHENSEFPFNLDFNSGNPLGVGWLQSTITSNGRRSSSATSYLGPRFMARRNLHVLLGHRVTRLLPRATSNKNTPSFEVVEMYPIIHGLVGQPISIRATREIVLSSGAIGSPHILLNSGIGDSASLRSVGISPTHHLPSVGRNFTDQPLVNVVYSANSTDTLDNLGHNATLFNMALKEWRLNGTGPLCTAGISHLCFSRLASNATIFNSTEDPAAGPDSPHIELSFFPGLPISPGHYFFANVFVLTPLSRGSISINSSNPFDDPLIDPSLLEHEFDPFAMREAVRVADRFIKSPAWKDYIIGPVGDLRGVDLGSDDQITAFLKSNVIAGLHGVGSASMSPKGASWGVTDPDLRVKGVNGIRIVDASVFPHIPAGHTQAPTYIMAERAADIIKEHWKLC